MESGRRIRCTQIQRDRPRASDGNGKEPVERIPHPTAWRHRDGCCWPHLGWTRAFAERRVDPHGHPDFFKPSNLRHRSGGKSWLQTAAIEPNGWPCERPHRRPLIGIVCHVTHTIGVDGAATVPCVPSHLVPQTLPRRRSPSPTACRLPAERRVRWLRRREGEPQCLTVAKRTNHIPVCGRTVAVHARSQAGFGTSGRPEPQIRCTNAPDLIH